jgi:hypothetical protein
MKFYVGNIQGSMKGSIIQPQEICVVDTTEGRTFHVFVKLDSVDKCATFARTLHGIPRNYGNDLGERLKNFVTAESVLYAKGEQQANSFKRLLDNTKVTVQSVRVKTLGESGLEKCYFHKLKCREFYCAREKAYALKDALTNKTTAEPEVCFFHQTDCRQPVDVCRLLFGTGTLTTLKSLWHPACFACQEPLIEKDANLFCINMKCKKFNSCVIKIENFNSLTGAIKYLSGARLTQNDFQKKFYNVM